MTSLRKRAARLAGFAIVTTGLVAGQLVYAPSAQAAEQVLDGGFEAAAPLGDSPNWTEADSLFGTPLCDSACGSAPAHTGAWFSWFGGTSTAGHTGSLSQSVTIPAGTHALSYWLRFPGGAAPFDATLTVKVDATTLKTYNEVLAAESDYTKRLVDITAFADGGAHTISFNYVNPSAGLTAWFLDDVSIDTTLNPTTTATPAVTSTVPASPSNATNPKVKGTAEAGSTVTLYANGTCTGAPLGSGTAADFAGAGITATVPSNATTTVFARASKDAQFDSVCSTTSVTYVNDAQVPNTTIAAPTTGSVVKSLTVPVTFSSSEAGSTFTCSLDTAPFTACTSPASVSVTAGQHTFRVIAKDAAQNADATPASTTFTAYDCTTLNAAVAKAQKKVDKAKKALKKAKKSGNATKIKKAKKKLKKAKKALKAAKAAAAPCGSTPKVSNADAARN